MWEETAGSTPVSFCESERSPSVSANASASRRHLTEEYHTQRDK